MSETIQQAYSEYLKDMTANELHELRIKLEASRQMFSQKWLLVQDEIRDRYL